MADGSSSGDHNGTFWQALRNLLFGDNGEPTLRDQIEDVIEEHEGEAPAVGDLSPVERQMLKNLLHFGERSVGEVAVQRGDIVAVPETIPFAELVAVFAEAGHSRLPVYRDELDTIVGMVHIKDVFAVLAAQTTPPDDLAELIRAPLYVPESMGVLDLLARMRAERIHLAIVVDEFGGTEGLVTIEDVVEEIVGDIEDEHDEEVEGALVPLDDGLWDADARAELDEVADTIDSRLAADEDEVDTLGGLAFLLAGHVPQVGEIITHPSGWRLEVTDGDSRRVTRLRLHPPSPADAVA
jgi:CBS domain containing-hemolysin-like protein